MAVFIVDTDILSLHQRNHPRVAANMLVHATDTIALSTVTIDEQFGGWSALARSAKSHQQIEHSRV